MSKIKNYETINKLFDFGLVEASSRFKNRTNDHEFVLKILRVHLPQWYKVREVLSPIGKWVYGDNYILPLSCLDELVEKLETNIDTKSVFKYKGFESHIYKNIKVCSNQTQTKDEQYADIDYVEKLDKIWFYEAIFKSLHYDLDSLDINTKVKGTSYMGSSSRCYRYTIEREKVSILNNVTGLSIDSTLGAILSDYLESRNQLSLF